MSNPTSTTSTSTTKPPPVKLTGNPPAISEFLSRFDTFLFDCDGVLWIGSRLLPHIPQTLAFLRSQNKKILFVTNNSTKSRAAYLAKLSALGIPAQPHEIVCSAFSSAVYISRVLALPAHEHVYVIGEAGILEELALEGVRAIADAPDAPLTDDDLEAFAPRDDVTVVLVGLDRNISYRKLARAYQFLQNPNCRFLATNIDSTFPTHGKLFPGAGSMSAPLTYMLGGTKPPLSLGKPSQAMMDAIELGCKLDRARTCMVGDRLNTDIRFGVEGGLGGTLAVLTGVCKEADLLDPEAEVRPDAYLDQLGDLLAAAERGGE